MFKYDNLTLFLCVCPISELHLSGPAAVRRPVLSGFPVQLVCSRGSGSRPAGQPHPEGAAPQGSAGYQPGEAPRLAAAAVHQHPLPGRTPKRGDSVAERQAEFSECRPVSGEGGSL